jgi:hypothetical protein
MGTELREYRVAVWTGGFKNQISNTWTWCKHCNSTTFGLPRTRNYKYNFTEIHDALNDTDFESCTKLAFSFTETGLICMDEILTQKLACESKSRATHADLVKIILFTLDIS